MLKDFKPIIMAFVLALVLQIVLAPNLMIFGRMPNFLLVATVLASLMMPGVGCYIWAFFAGLCFDLLGLGPVGAQALSLLMLSLVVSKAMRLLDNATLFVPFVIILLGCLLGECLYLTALTLTGNVTDVLAGFVTRVLPLSLYNTVISCGAFALILKMAGRPRHNEIRNTSKPLR